MNNNWIKEFAGAVTVCDKEGIILSMNDKAIKVFQDDGGERLIGQNLFDCHTPRSKEILQDLIENEKTNVYTIEKNGIKKFIYQAPWYKDGVYAGLVELALEIPFEVPHFIRDKKNP